MSLINDPIEKEFKIEFYTKDDYNKFLTDGFTVIRTQDVYNQATVKINTRDTAKLITSLKNYNVKFISEIPYTLERHFKEVLKAKKEAK